MTAETEKTLQDFRRNKKNIDITHGEMNNRPFPISTFLTVEQKNAIISGSIESEADKFMNFHLKNIQEIREEIESILHNSNSDRDELLSLLAPDIHAIAYNLYYGEGDISITLGRLKQICGALGLDNEEVDNCLEFLDVPEVSHEAYDDAPKNTDPPNLSFIVDYMQKRIIDVCFLKGIWDDNGAEDLAQIKIGSGAYSVDDSSDYSKLIHAGEKFTFTKTEDEEVWEETKNQLPSITIDQLRDAIREGAIVILDSKDGSTDSGE